MKLEIAIIKNPTTFSVFCPYFPGVIESGNTQEDAILNFKDMLTFALEHKKQRAILDDFLKENNWNKIENKWSAPKDLDNLNAEQTRWLDADICNYTIIEIDFEHSEFL